GLADVAFVGGSMDGKRGGQNMIEPAGFGAAGGFGKVGWDFREPGVRLMEQQGAGQGDDAGGLERGGVRLVGDPAAGQMLGQNAQRYVLDQRGATRKTLDALDGLVTRCEQRRVAA